MPRQGTKFTMRMEDVVGEEYLGIRVFRFYFHCKSCSAEITMCASAPTSRRTAVTHPLPTVTFRHVSSDPIAIHK